MFTVMFVGTALVCGSGLGFVAYKVQKRVEN
jgi:hypothetical protein